MFWSWSSDLLELEYPKISLAELLMCNINNVASHYAGHVLN
jgi:hypothetical protein